MGHPADPNQNIPSPSDDDAEASSAHSADAPLAADAEIEEGPTSSERWAAEESGYPEEEEAPEPSPPPAPRAIRLYEFYPWLYAHGHNTYPWPADLHAPAEVTDPLIQMIVEGIAAEQKRVPLDLYTEIVAWCDEHQIPAPPKPAPPSPPRAAPPKPHLPPPEPAKPVTGAQARERVAADLRRIAVGVIQLSSVTRADVRWFARHAVAKAEKHLEAGVEAGVGRTTTVLARGVVDPLVVNLMRLAAVIDGGQRPAGGTREAVLTMVYGTDKKAWPTFALLDL